jgi:hypothetical protein
MTNARTITAAAVLAAMVLTAGVPASAMPMTAVAIKAAPHGNVVQVRGHHGHWHDHHRRDHRFHGRDDYYDRDDQSGTLFKSFVTGTLFHGQ